MKNLVVATFVSIALLLVSGSYVFASECFVFEKPDGAGNIGDVYVGGPSAGEPTNGGGQTKGGFVDVYVWVGTHYIQVQDDTFLLPASEALDADPAPKLPDGAMESAGPGKGIDENHH